MTAYDITDSFWWVLSHQRVGPMMAYDIIRDSFRWVPNHQKVGPMTTDDISLFCWACRLHGCGCLLQPFWVLLWQPTMPQAASCILS